MIIKKRSKEAIQMEEQITQRAKKTGKFQQEVISGLIKNKKLKLCYEKIKVVLRKYMDLEEADYGVISLWIIGTYFHKQFSTYPYLFFNAMKGSGKTRILKIISLLSKDGKLAGSLTESVLFRTASKRTICLDEFENMNAKGNENLKLLLNSAYKKGLAVERESKRKTLEGEQYVPEEFNVYCPIAMANIWGVENILSDRCILIILEKSSKTKITKLIENFDNEEIFIEIRKDLKSLSNEISDDLNLFGDLITKWNEYQIQKENVVNVVNEVSKVNVVNEVSKNNQKTDDIYDIYDITTHFKDIDDSNLSGRDLELFFPLFVLSELIGENILKETIETSKFIVKERKARDVEENKDAMLYEFIAQSNYDGNYVAVEQVVYDLKQYFGEEEVWINSRGISRALGRLKLKIDTRSTGKKKTVKINVEKAKEKLKMFKDVEEKSKKTITDDVPIIKINETQEVKK